MTLCFYHALKTFCRFVSHNLEETFEGADMKSFMKTLIYTMLEAMGLGSNIDVAAVIDLNELAEKGKMMVVEALKTPFCDVRKLFNTWFTC